MTRCHLCLKRIWPWQTIVMVGAGPEHIKCIIRDCERHGLVIADEFMAWLKNGGHR